MEGFFNENMKGVISVFFSLIDLDEESIHHNFLALLRGKIPVSGVIDRRRLRRMQGRYSMLQEISEGLFIFGRWNVGRNSSFFLK